MGFVNDATNKAGDIIDDSDEYVRVQMYKDMIQLKQTAKSHQTIIQMMRMMRTIMMLLTYLHQHLHTNLLMQPHPIHRIHFRKMMIQNLRMTL